MMSRQRSPRHVHRFGHDWRALRPGIVLVFGLWCWLFPSSASADYRDEYCQGVEAARRNRWADVARRMQAAIRERPEEGGLIRCTYLNQFPYVPHFYLGRALKEQGDCRGALVEWNISESHKVIRTLATEYRVLAEGRRACPSEPAPLVAEAKPRETVPPPRESTPTTPATLPPPVQPAAPVESPAPAPASPPVSSPPPVTPVERAAISPPIETPTSIRPTAPTVPAVLMLAAQAYFDGEYQQTVGLLRAVETLDGSFMRAQGHLFMSAAKYALLQIEGDGNAAALRREAESAARASRRADSSVSPESGFFSPGFVAFFRSVR